MGSAIRYLSAIVALFVGVLVASCGGDGEDQPRTARVSAHQVFAAPTNYGEEGTASFLKLDRAGGGTTERFLTLPRADKPEYLFEGDLEIGSYTVRSYQRTCPPASCRPTHGAAEPSDDEDYLDPPSAVCRGRFQLEQGHPVAVLVVLDPLTASCDVHTGPPPDRLTRFLIEAGIPAIDLPAKELPTKAPLLRRDRRKLSAKLRPTAGVRVILGEDALGHIYRFGSERIAQAAAPAFLQDSGDNGVSGCGRHIYFTDARRVPRDDLLRRDPSWEQEIQSALERVDPSCRAGGNLLVTP